jgi:uncharacterized protein YbjT (DUF2867 family)
MYAIMGITGKVGGAVARRLLEAAIPVRALVREAGKGAPWAARGCAIAIGDLDDAGTLAAGFAGTDGVFVMMPSIFDPTPGFAEAKANIATLRAALDKARPSRVVALSTIGADSTRPNLLNQLGLMEQALSELPIPMTFLRAAWFMDNAALDVASARESGVIQSYLQPLDRPVPMIATADVGRTAADLLRENWGGTRVVELEATSRVTPNAIAAAFGAAFGHTVRADAVPREGWETLFRAQGMQNPAPRMQMIDGFNEGWIDFAERGAHARKGQVTIEEVVGALVKAKR